MPGSLFPELSPLLSAFASLVDPDPVAQMSRIRVTAGEERAQTVRPMGSGRRAQ